jgi:tetratricopeptide (TPR) repeat protein
MKKLFLLATIAAFSMNLMAQVSMPAPSTTQTIKQAFGIGSIELTYSRPSIKGRKVFAEGSELAPLGKLWRTGANAATKLKFTDFVSIGGKKLDSGTYVLYTIPNNNEWEIIINKGIENWGVDGYKESEDVVRLKVPVTKIGDNIETFTMQFADVKNESCELHLMWGNVAIKVPIATDIKDRLRKQVETALQKAPYQQAANFYFEWDKNYPKALENINKAIEGNPKAFWMYMTKAKIEKEMGDKKAAKMSAEKTIELATQEKNDDYVRQAKDLISKL